MSTSSATRTTQPTPSKTTALATTKPVVRLKRRPGHARQTPTTWQKRGRMSKILIGKYQATIYLEGDGYAGAISLGFDGQGKRQRIRRRAKTKAAVRDKL